MTRYFCHACKKMMTHINADYTCPHCENGFIEESQVDLSEEDNPAPMDFLQFFYSGLPPSPPASSTSSSPSPSSSSQSHHHHHHHHHHTNPYHFRPQRQSHPHSHSHPHPPHQAASQNHYHHHSTPACSTSQLYSRGHSHGLDFRHPPTASSSSRFRPRLENSTDSMLYSFISDLVTGLGGGHHGNSFPFLAANFGDYVWGRDGLDEMVTQLMNNMEGTGPPPLDNDKLVQLPNAKIEQKHVDAKLQCSVCWDDFLILEEVKMLSCDHMYHPNCIIPWLKLHGTCPVCRKDLNESGAGEEGIDDDTETSASASGRSRTGISSSRIDDDDDVDDDVEIVPVPVPVVEVLDHDMEINYDFD